MNGVVRYRVDKQTKDKIVRLLDTNVLEIIWR